MFCFFLSQTKLNSIHFKRMVLLVFTKNLAHFFKIISQLMFFVHPLCLNQVSTCKALHSLTYHAISLYNSCIMRQMCCLTTFMKHPVAVPGMEDPLALFLVDIIQHRLKQCTCFNIIGWHLIKDRLMDGWMEGWMARGRDR